MKLGELLTYKDINFTVRLIGKRCKFSNVLSEIEHGKGISSTLSDVVPGNDYPFVFNLPGGKERYQFIREVIEDDPEEPRYKPYDLSDPAVRKSLRGRWYKRVDRNDFERAIDTFYCNDGRWTVNAYDAEYFLKYFNWLDGTPCGQLVHAGEGHVEGNASVRGIDG